MRGLRLLVALLVSAISACGVLEKPLTATPWIVTSTPAPLATNTPLLTPTREVLATAVPFQVVNVNAFLQGQPQVIQVGGRTLEIPPGWCYVGTANPPPFVYRRDDGYNFEPSWIAGKFGLCQDGIQLEGGQRYIVKATFTAGLLHTGDISVAGRIFNTDGGTVTELRSQSFPLRGYSEIIWVIQSDKENPTIRLEVTYSIQWASFEGTIVWHSVEVQTAPQDFGSDALIRF